MLALLNAILILAAVAAWCGHIAARLGKTSAIGASLRGANRDELNPRVVTGGLAAVIAVGLTLVVLGGGEAPSVEASEQQATGSGSDRFAYSGPDQVPQWWSALEGERSSELELGEPLGTFGECADGLVWRPLNP